MFKSTQLDKDVKYINKYFKKKKFFKKKTILITGSNGFICFTLQNYLISCQDTLKFKKLILTDINDKSSNRGVDNKKIFYKKFDIVKNSLSIFFKEKFDIIIHAASIASPTFYRKFPIETADANVLGLRKILEYSKNNKNCRILYFSSSEIYGSPDKKNIPTKEEYNGNVSTIGPRACYDEAKRYCETLCYIFYKKFNIPVRIVRPFNNYGPGMKMNDSRLPADLANSVYKKKNFVLYSRGKDTRTFCYIADAMVGYLEALSYKSFEIFNIGNNDNEISVKNFAKKFSYYSYKINNFKPKIIFKKSKDKEYLTNNPNRRCPNIDKAKKLINFKARINLDEGIQRFLKFIKEMN
jgi:UDP-glucuronate decarboxylase